MPTFVNLWLKFLQALADVILWLLSFWWIILPLVLLYLLFQTWMLFINLRYRKAIRWVMLSVRIPREILKTPKAMEVVFAAAHGIYTFGMNFWDEYLKGKVEERISFEIVGNANGVYFYIRVNEDFRNLIEAAVYSQYPDAEIERVDDYVEEFPSVLPNEQWELFGSDIVLAREDAFPIRTYPYFEALVAEEKLDSMAQLVEVLSQLKADETVWLQLVLQPLGAPTSNWMDEARKIRDKIIGRKAPPKKVGLITKGLYWISNILTAIFVEPAWWEESVETEKPRLTLLSPIEREQVEAIERKIGKPAFEGVIRFIYLDRKDKFTRPNAQAVLGTFRQFAEENLNSPKPNLNMMTISRKFFRAIFKQTRLYFRKRRIYDYYRWRTIPRKRAIFNIEELATLYHFPAVAVEAPMLKRIEAKKGEPPVGLPLE